jgi:hypothetical protein
MAALRLSGVIIYLINSGFESISLIIGFESAICLNIGLELTMFYINYGSANIYYTIGLLIIYDIIYGSIPPIPPMPPIPPIPGKPPIPPIGIPPKGIPPSPAAAPVAPVDAVEVPVLGCA